MKWKLHDKAWNVVAEVELSDDAPDVVIFEDQIFFYDERVHRYVTPTVYICPAPLAVACNHSEPLRIDDRARAVQRPETSNDNGNIG